MDKKRSASVGREKKKSDDVGEAIFYEIDKALKDVLSSNRIPDQAIFY